MEKQNLTKDSYKSSRKKIIEIMVEQSQIGKNSKYGEFIIQTNKIQFLLIGLISLRVCCPDKKNKNELAQLTLGSLIVCFRICAKNPAELELVKDLEDYKKMRNKLAHKMFTDKKLTTKECELAIEMGNELITVLRKIIIEIKI